MSSRLLLAALFLTLLGALPLSAEDATTPVKPTGDGSSLAERTAIVATELDAIHFERNFETGSKDAPSQARTGELDGLALGVWVSRPSYREGEPIPALFAVRNQGGRRGLDLRIDLSTSLAPQYNSARIDLHRTNAGNFWGQSLVAIQVCGGDPLTIIERGGYYCSSGDLRTLGEGHLPPGTYRLSWVYRGLKSNVVRFTVHPTAERLPPPSRAAHRFAVLQIVGGKLERLTSSDREHPLRLTGADLSRHWTGVVRGQLASGVAGKYYPDIRSLPVVDGGVEASAQWIGPVRAGCPRGVEVTLRPTGIAGVLALERNVRLGLLIEPHPLGVPLKGEAPSSRAGGRAEGKATQPLVLDRPITYRIELPEDWTKHVRFSGPARVAVVVTSERIFERPSGLLLEEAKVLRSPSSAVLWQGVLRSPWLDLELASGTGNSGR